MQRFIVGEGSRVGRVILDDDDLKIVISGVFVQACQAAVQIISVVLVRDQHTDLRVARQLIPDLERPGRIGHRHGVPRQTEALQLGIDGALTRCDGVGLGLHAGGGGTRVAAPDIEHLFDMLDAMRFFCQPQDQVVVLCAVKLLRLIGSGRIQQRAAEHRQMGDEVHAAQIVRCKIRLEVIPAQLF